MPNAIDAIAVKTNSVTTTEPVVVNQTPAGDVAPMRRAGNVGAGGYTTERVAGRGVDPSAFSRRSTAAPETAAPAPAAVVEPAKPEKVGFFKRIGRALNPSTWAKKLAKNHRRTTRAIGWAGTAAAGAATAATGLLVAQHFAPVAVHGLLMKVGMLGLLGPAGAAVGGAIAAGVLGLGLFGVGRAFLRAGKKPAAPAPKPADPAEKPKEEEKKKPSFFRRATSAVLKTVGIGGGFAIGGYGLFQAAGAVLGGATIAAAAPMLLLPAAAILGGSILVAAAKAIGGSKKD